MSSKKARVLNNMEAAAFCEQMSMILKSGISSYEGINVMLEDAESTEEKQLFEQIRSELDKGSGFAEALSSCESFPPYLIRMAGIGEETGSLDTVMEKLAAYYTREDELHRSIRSSVMYPAVMTVMMLLLVIIMLVKIMPVFDSVFRQLGSEMSAAGKALMAAGTVLSRYSAVFVLILAVIAGLTVWAIRTDSGRKKMLSFAYRFKAVRRITDKTSLCRFAGGISLALSSGCSQNRAFELAAGLVNEGHFDSRLASCRVKLDSGMDLIDALKDSSILSGLDARLAGLGRRTGSLDSAFAQISEAAQAEVDDTLDSLLAVLEPSIVVALSIVAGIILLSVMLPLIGIMSAV